MSQKKKNNENRRNISFSDENQMQIYTAVEEENEDNDNDDDKPNQPEKQIEDTRQQMDDDYYDAAIKRPLSPKSLENKYGYMKGMELKNVATNCKISLSYAKEIVKQIRDEYEKTKDCDYYNEVVVDNLQKKLKSFYCWQLHVDNLDAIEARWVLFSDVEKARDFRDLLEVNGLRVNSMTKARYHIHIKNEHIDCIDSPVVTLERIRELVKEVQYIKARNKQMHIDDGDFDDDGSNSVGGYE